MPRTITSHQVNGCNAALHIKVLDEPGSGGANHRYAIYVPHDGFNEELNASLAVHLAFQNGPIKEAGVNGITHEALIAVLMDRLDGFQKGPFACPLNAKALYHLGRAAAALHERTKQRAARGVEGTHAV